MALAGCGGGPADTTGGGYGAGYGVGAGAPWAGHGQPLPGRGPGGERVAILLPLSGPRAEIGQPMLQAAQLAMDAGRPDARREGYRRHRRGAAAAAQAAVADGAGLILGPLTSAETAAVAPVARQANVAVLAFTNDPSQAQPGVWTLGHNARPAGAAAGRGGAGAGQVADRRPAARTPTSAT